MRQVSYDPDTGEEIQPRYNGGLSSVLLPKKKTPEEEAQEQYTAQQQQYDQSLADTQTKYAEQAASTQKANDDAYAEAQAKMQASRDAADAAARNKQTFSDNTARDLTSNGQNLVVAGGSAQDADAQDSGGDLKKKKVGAISSQLGINV